MRYLTAGESHGPRLTAIIEGVPAGLPLSEEDIDKELKRRQDHIRGPSWLDHGRSDYAECDQSGSPKMAGDHECSTGRREKEKSA